MNIRAPAKVLPWAEQRVKLILRNYQNYVEGKPLKWPTGTQKLASQTASRLPPWYVDANAEVHHEAPDRHHGFFWTETELTYISTVLENIYEYGHDYPKLRERIVYAVAGTTGFAIPEETLTELRRATHRQARQIREQAEAAARELPTVEEFHMTDPGEALSESEDNNDDPTGERSSTTSQSRWGP